MSSSDQFDNFNWKIMMPGYFRLFLLFKLPSAYFSGIRLNILTDDQCWVTIRKKWFNKNPFKSIYFASLAMAAEMSTGVLVMGHTYKRNPKVSMLVATVEASYMKKAVGKITFKCSDGVHIANAVDTAIKHGKTIKVIAFSFGYDKTGDMVASFKIVWSLKALQPPPLF